MQEQSKKLVTGKLREVALEKIDEQTEALVYPALIAGLGHETAHLSAGVHGVIAGLCLS